MYIYRKSKTSSLKWVIAGILFISIMTFTLSEVNGIGTPNKPTAIEKKSEPRSTQNNEPIIDEMNQDHSNPNDNPSPVPEPGTIALMALGLSGLYLTRKNRKISE